jgi:hypothetical protein
MTYSGRVKKGVVVFDGPQRPAEGASVRVVEMESGSPPVGQGLDELAGKAKGLPDDLAQKHDEYRRRKRAS